MSEITSSPVFWVVIKILVIFFILITCAAYYTLAERRWAGFFQDRLGPNRAGFWGLLQPLADGIKFLTKQETFPRNVDKVLFLLAPMVSMSTAILLWSTVPFTPEIILPLEAALITGSETFALQVFAPDTGILFLFAISSLSVYGIMLAGWSSNNKYSLLGSVRATAQMISYELALSLSVVAVVLMAGSLELHKIIQAQANRWYLFTLPGLMSFAVFIVAVFAETNRLPFDLAEAESELVVGFHTEYGAFKFALFFIAEYMNMITLSFLTVVLFMGGWNLPFFIPASWSGEWYGPLIGVGFMILKVFFFVFLFVWVRWTLPRFRYDQLMSLGWRKLVPFSFLTVAVAALYTLAGRV